MVRWLRDPTGRFNERPHYLASELDNECELLVHRFMNKTHGRLTYPIETDDLEKLIESRAHDLDMYADLGEDGKDVEGVTRFARNRKPSVAISQDLSEAENRRNRLRTTMTHEFGHVHFHDSLFQMKLAAGDLFAVQRDEKIVCKRDRIVDAPQVDWMEWQACYASGAILMPKSAVMKTVEEFRRQGDFAGAIVSGTDASATLIQRIQTIFDVSAEAARIRLIKLDVLSARSRQGSLF